MNTTEWVAALTTLSSVIMLSKGKIAGWILGILGSFFYVTIFFEQNLFANLLLQIVFIVQGFYGIYEWKKDIKKDENFLSKNLNSDILVAFLFYTISFSLIICLSFSLYKINEILDITLSIFSILAMILMAKNIFNLGLYGYLSI
jgi:nicotinamide mononucleotide transporter